MVSKDFFYQYIDILYTDTTTDALSIGYGAKGKMSKHPSDLMVQKRTHLQMQDTVATLEN